jgi:ABC-type uncharacterized transport system substrate-binding protein
MRRSLTNLVHKLRFSFAPLCGISIARESGTTMNKTVLWLLTLALSFRPHSPMRNGKRSTELTSSSLAEHGTTIDGLRVELRQLALEPGKQLNLVIRETKGDAKATEKAARNLEEEKIDLIYTAATSVTLAAKRATLDTSIVFAAGADPVVLGLVDSFSSPETGSQAYSTGTAILPVNA